jgi:hypothetical protein
MISDQEIINCFNLLSIKNIDEKLSDLRERIKVAQHMITVLTLTRSIVTKSKEISRISSKTADTMIDEALQRINGTPSAAPPFTAEGGIRS